MLFMAAMMCLMQVGTGLQRWNDAEPDDRTLLMAASPIVGIICVIALVVMEFI